MSPAATRRYRVSFVDWEVHEVIVMAVDQDAAVTKAIAMYQLNGVAEFTSGDKHAVDWKAELVREEVR